MSLVLTGGAQAACPSPQGTSLSGRLDDADAAVVGRVVAIHRAELGGLTQRVLTIDVDQHVKGDLPKQIDVWTPSGTACALTPKRDKELGLLLTRSPEGDWVATSASLVDPGRLVVAGGEPRGGPIKVGVGLVLLVLVLLWAVSRRRRGVWPQLPGGPRP